MNLCFVLQVALGELSWYLWIETYFSGHYDTVLVTHSSTWQSNDDHNSDSLYTSNKFVFNLALNNFEVESWDIYLVILYFDLG